MLFNRKSRSVPYCVSSDIKKSELPYTVYFERLRTIEGLLMCGVGLYLISRIYSEPVYTFNGDYIWYLIFGALFLGAGLPLCFICSGGCALISKNRIIIYRTRCFRRRTLTSVPGSEIICACRISSGRKGIVGAFIAMVAAFIKGDKDKASEMRDAAFLTGCLEICTADRNYRIRLNKNQANFALSDIADMCERENGGEKTENSFSILSPIICAAVAVVVVIVSGVVLTANAKHIVEQQYIKAVYQEDTEAFSQAYVEFAHLAEQYSYLDSDFRSKYCYARLEISQGNFEKAVERINALGDFDDKNELLYYCALCVEEQNSAALAAGIYTGLGDYKDSAERLEVLEESYNTAATAYENGEFLIAAEGFTLLRDYKQTEDYVALLADEAEKTVPPQGNPENLSSKQIIERCKEALPLLEILSWDSECASLKALCEEYIEIYTFD